MLGFRYRELSSTDSDSDIEGNRNQNARACLQRSPRTGEINFQLKRKESSNSKNATLQNENSSINVAVSTDEKITEQDQGRTINFRGGTTGLHNKLLSSKGSSRSEKARLKDIFSREKEIDSALGTVWNYSPRDRRFVSMDSDSDESSDSLRIRTSRSSPQTAESKTVKFDNSLQLPCEESDSDNEREKSWAWHLRKVLPGSHNKHYVGTSGVTKVPRSATFSCSQTTPEASVQPNKPYPVQKHPVSITFGPESVQTELGGTNPPGNNIIESQQYTLIAARSSCSHQTSSSGEKLSVTLRNQFQDLRLANENLKEHLSAAGATGQLEASVMTTHDL
jgi:hypothetical protein